VEDRRRSSLVEEGTRGIGEEPPSDPQVDETRIGNIRPFDEIVLSCAQLLRPTAVSAVRRRLDPAPHARVAPILTSEGR